jgi:hypothetical protein
MIEFQELVITDILHFRVRRCASAFPEMRPGTGKTPCGACMMIFGWGLAVIGFCRLRCLA